MAMVHIIGAGVTGLAAATRLAEAHIPVRLYEATAHAGGRARSSNHATLGTIDHGLHFVGGDARELFSYLTRIGARDELIAVDHPLRFPAAPIIDYAELLGLFAASSGQADALFSPDNILRDGWASRAARLLFHTPLSQLGSAPAHRMARGFLRRPRPAMRAYMARHSLQESFIAPGLAHLDYLGSSVYFNHPLQALTRQEGRVTGLAFPRQKLPVAKEDVVILAVPAQCAAQLLPEIRMGGDTHCAITLHYQVPHGEPARFEAPDHAPVDLIRYQPGRISLGLRVADHAWQGDSAFLAARLWRFLQKRHLSLAELPLPAYAIWREKQAGHRFAPDHMPHIPPLDERLLVAGDWCEAHLPSSLETAAASGHRAAESVLALLGRHPLRRQ